MTNVVALNSRDHRHLRVQASASARYGDSQNFVAVIVNEFPFLVVQYPILFSKDSETGAFYCGAMLGFDKGENLFLDERKGFDGYRPLNLQRGPFYTAGGDVAIDLDHPRIDGGGQELFTENGEPSAYLNRVIALFRELRPGLDATRGFIETVVRLRIVEPIDISATFDDGTKRKLEGLYTIDHEALQRLPDDAVVDLFRRGYLQLIYLMIASLKQIPALAQRKNARLLEATGALT
jgi:hypothetical protein